MASKQRVEPAVALIPAAPTLSAEELCGDEDDVDIMQMGKHIFPAEFTNNWIKGIREINIEADAWNGLSARKNVIIKINMTRWGLDLDLKTLSSYLVHLQCLRSLYLDENPETLKGDLADLSNLTSLETLSIARCPNVTGDIGSLAPLENLRALFCEHTGVGGDLKGLELSNELMVLSMSHTKVKGNIKVCALFPNLTWLILSNTEVKGKNKTLFFFIIIVEGCSYFAS
jgi:hypothetical protein